MSLDNLYARLENLSNPSTDSIPMEITIPNSIEGKQVLEESDYSKILASSIQQNFFPSLPKLRIQAAWNSAIKTKNPHVIKKAADNILSYLSFLEKQNSTREKHTHSTDSLSLSEKSKKSFENFEKSFISEDEAYFHSINTQQRNLENKTIAQIHDKSIALAAQSRNFSTPNISNRLLKSADASLSPQFTEEARKSYYNSLFFPAEHVIQTIPSPETSNSDSINFDALFSYPQDQNTSDLSLASNIHSLSVLFPKDERVIELTLLYSKKNPQFLQLLGQFFSSKLSSSIQFNSTELTSATAPTNTLLIPQVGKGGNAPEGSTESDPFLRYDKGLFNRPLPLPIKNNK